MPATCPRGSALDIAVHTIAAILRDSMQCDVGRGQTLVRAPCTSKAHPPAPRPAVARRLSIPPCVIPARCLRPPSGAAGRLDRASPMQHRPMRTSPICPARPQKHAHASTGTRASLCELYTCAAAWIGLLVCVTYI
ncbi:hypothetical protein HYPSUDRAFT_38005, partial [Hypholoma sublateritium FD-334 SS-4]